MKQILFLCLAFVLLFTVGCSGGEREPSAANRAPSEVQIDVGAAAPVFTLGGMGGTEAKVTPGDGKVYVINFWATWCPPCRKELPDIEKFAESHKERVSFYAVNIEEPEEKVTGFLKENGYELPVLFDKDGRATMAYQVSAVPTTFVIDASGKIAAKFIGVTTEADLEKALQALR